MCAATKMSETRVTGSSIRASTNAQLRLRRRTRRASTWLSPGGKRDEGPVRVASWLYYASRTPRPRRGHFRASDGGRVPRPPFATDPRRSARRQENGEPLGAQPDRANRPTQATPSAHSTPCRKGPPEGTASRRAALLHRGGRRWANRSRALARGVRSPPNEALRRSAGGPRGVGQAVRKEPKMPMKTGSHLLSAIGPRHCGPTFRHAFRPGARGLPAACASRSISSAALRAAGPTLSPAIMRASSPSRSLPAPRVTGWSPGPLSRLSRPRNAHRRTRRSMPDA